MSIFGQTIHSALRGEATITAALAAMARGIGRVAFDALQPRRQSDDVWTLDDRMLDDIGLTRGDVLRPDFHGGKRG